MTAERWGVQAGDPVGVEFLIPCRFCDQWPAGRYLLCKSPVDSYGGDVPSKRGLGCLCVRARRGSARSRAAR
jgi:threonine dehydrogenase-like Zn-dependent dehydrogenase